MRVISLPVGTSNLLMFPELVSDSKCLICIANSTFLRENSKIAHILHNWRISNQYQIILSLNHVMFYECGWIYLWLHWTSRKRESKSSDINSTQLVKYHMNWHSTSMILHYYVATNFTCYHATNISTWYYTTNMSTYQYATNIST